MDRTRRLLGLLAAAMTVACILTACGTGQGASGASNANGAQAANNQPAPQNSEHLTGNTTGRTVADYDIAFDQWIQSMFSDGVAWVKASGAWADRFTLCPLLIDADGNVLIDYTDGNWTDSQVPMSTTNYCDGVCLINVDDTYCGTADYLIDKSGNVIWSVAEDGQRAASEFFPANSVNRVEAYFSMRYNDGNASSSDGWNSDFYGGDWFNGYTVVSFDVTTYEDTSTKYGVLDSSGKWVIEPGEDECLTGKYCIVTPSSEIVFRTGEVSEHATMSPETDYSYKSGSELREYFDALEDREYLEAHNGLILDYVDGGYAFVDNSGKAVIDLSGYSEIWDRETTEFSDGYCSLFVSGKDGNGRFVTVIDTNGNEQFTPTAFDGLSSADDARYSECAIAIDGSYFDKDGNQLGTVEAERCREFTDGRAWFTVGSEYHCIDASGNQVF